MVAFYMPFYFRFGHLILVLAHGYSFEIVMWSRKVFKAKSSSLLSFSLGTECLKNYV